MSKKCWENLKVGFLKPRIAIYLQIKVYKNPSLVSLISEMKINDMWKGIYISQPNHFKNSRYVQGEL